MREATRIFVAGHRGLVGSAIVRNLQRRGFRNLVLRTHSELDLSDQAAVDRFFREEGPEVVILAAAKVGGILANSTYPAEFIHANLAIQTNVLAASHEAGVSRLLFLGSSCIYPRDCPQPIKEDYLLTGPLEVTNRPYAIAKIAGIEMCASFNRQYGTRYLAVMPTNLYGPGDNYDLETSHFVPAIIRKCIEAKAKGHDRVVLWGTGSPRRELLHSDDMADACIHLLTLPEASFREACTAHDFPLLNVGSGVDSSIREIAEQIRRITGFEGSLSWDRSKPDGTPRKLLSVDRLNALGWSSRISLDEGLRSVVAQVEPMFSSAESP